MKPAITRETILDRRQPVMRWGAVFAGAVVSIGLWVLLQTLGVGLGLEQNDSGTATAIWALVAPIIAMFLGGMIAARFATTYSRGVGALHGLVVWAISGVLGVAATASLVAMLVSNGDRVVGPTVEDAQATGKALLFLGATLLVSLVAAMLGGVAGVRRYVVEDVRRTTVTQVPPPVVTTTDVVP
jgi:MFS family permease